MFWPIMDLIQYNQKSKKKLDLRLVLVLLCKTSLLSSDQQRRRLLKSKVNCNTSASRKDQTPLPVNLGIRC